MTDQFQPLEFPRFTYTDVPVAPAIDYKAAYELQRITTMRVMQAYMALIDDFSKLAPAQFKEKLAQARERMGKVLLEM